MSFIWEKAFSQSIFPWKNIDTSSEYIGIKKFKEFKDYLDLIHIKYCLLRPYFEQGHYPIVEHRDLLPSFEIDLLEYKELPGFSMVVFDRPLESFNEIFQYDILHICDQDSLDQKLCKQPAQSIEKNIYSFLARLPKKMQESFRQDFDSINITQLNSYPKLLSYLTNMDRAHVFALNVVQGFYLAGIFASFPSDMDGEIKRFGLKIRKFRLGDNILYEQNRLFVYHFLMELYGFPVASERRTSAALFARRLHKMGERFMVRVLGQSDRVITTISNTGTNRYYPHVEKIALVKIAPGQTELITRLSEGGYFVDVKKRIVIIRITYKHHRYNAENVRQERALSVERQDVIHPFTASILEDVNIIKDTGTMILNLNDIVRGEYVGRIVYKRNELIESTDTDEKRLKFLFAWLSKNQRRIISYRDDFYNSATKVLDTYLHDPLNRDVFDQNSELYQDVVNKYAYIRQARMVKYLEDIMSRKYKGKKIGYNKMLSEAVNILRELNFEIVNYFEQLTRSVIHHIEAILDDKYLRRKYIDVTKENLTASGYEIRKTYGKLVSLHDAFVSIYKTHHDSS